MPIPDSPDQVLDCIGRALADPLRRRVLVVLHRGPAYPADLAEQLGVSRSNLSNHLALLRACTLVDSVTQGRRSLYRIADTHAAFALRALLDTANPEVPAAGGGAA